MPIRGVYSSHNLDSVSGSYVYRGKAVPACDRYQRGDYCSGTHQEPQGGQRSCNRRSSREPFRSVATTSFGVDVAVTT